MIFSRASAQRELQWTILVDLLYGFVTTFDWSKFGLAIADFITGWFEEIDFTKAVQTAQTLILGLFDALQQAIQNVEWYKIGTEIMDSIESTVYNGSTVVAELRVENNSSVKSVVEFGIESYDRIRIEILKLKVGV